MKNIEDTEYYEDEVYHSRLLISVRADRSELAENVRAARAILYSFPNTSIIITEHRLILDVKNPEYIIDGLIGDRKGVQSEKGIRSSFEKGKKQCCKVIVIDLDMNMGAYPLRTRKLAKELYFRKCDIQNGIIERCYIVYHDKSVLLTKSHFTEEKDDSKSRIILELQKIAE